MLQKLSEISDNPHFRNIESILYIGEERARVGAKAKSVEAAWMQPNPPLTSILLWILLPNGNEISYTGNICNIGQLRNKRVVYYLLSFSKFSFKVHISLKTGQGLGERMTFHGPTYTTEEAWSNRLMACSMLDQQGEWSPHWTLASAFKSHLLWPYKALWSESKNINYVKPRSGSYLPPTQVYMETPFTSPASCREINKSPSIT